MIESQESGVTSLAVPSIQGSPLTTPHSPSPTHHSPLTTPLSPILTLWNRNILALNEVLVLHLQKIRIVGIVATFQAVHVARRRVCRPGQPHALAAEVERPAVTRAQKA